MDGFTLVLIGGIAAVVGLLWLVGRSDAIEGSDRLGLDARKIEERRTALEMEDDEQVHAALAQLRERRAMREGGRVGSLDPEQADG